MAWRPYHGSELKLFCPPPCLDPDAALFQTGAIGGCFRAGVSGLRIEPPSGGARLAGQFSMRSSQPRIARRGKLNVMSIEAQGPVSAVAEIPAPVFNMRWALRRALLGVIILVLGIGTMAWLTHASIDPSLDGVAPQANAR